VLFAGLAWQQWVFVFLSDVAMIVTGLIGNLDPTGAKWGWFLFGCVFQSARCCCSPCRLRACPRAMDARQTLWQHLLSADASRRSTASTAVLMHLASRCTDVVEQSCLRTLSDRRKRAVIIVVELLGPARRNAIAKGATHNKVYMIALVYLLAVWVVYPFVWALQHGSRARHLVLLRVGVPVALNCLRFSACLGA
jgi:Bacteriorhodopsin-like protein